MKWELYYLTHALLNVYYILYHNSIIKIIIIIIIIHDP